MTPFDDVTSKIQQSLSAAVLNIADSAIWEVANLFYRQVFVPRQQ